MARSAVIVVDMLNPYDHEDADRLVESVEGAIEPIAGLVERAVEQGAEIIYVNDNYGDWNSSQEELAEAALNGSRPELVEPILPLEYLLSQKGIGHVVLAGQVTTDLAEAALKMMERNMQAELVSAADCQLEE